MRESSAQAVHWSCNATLPGLCPQFLEPEERPRSWDPEPVAHGVDEAAIAALKDTWNQR